ncbi:hypothetical protein L810_8622 [Burkholderia sp. AU4i]|nr:hypothetical protein L810_8622 [Burkholderia sp. AU4i]MDW9225788.1 hypothetical protein [Burkholderia cepacia]
MHRYAAAFTSRPAAGMCVPMQSAGTMVCPVVAFASDVSFAFA